MVMMMMMMMMMCEGWWEGLAILVSRHHDGVTQTRLASQGTERAMEDQDHDVYVGFNHVHDPAELVVLQVPCLKDL